MPPKLYALFLIVFIQTLIFPACAAADDLSVKRQEAGFFFVEEITLTGEEISTVNFLVFCDTQIKAAPSAIIIALGGNIYIDGGFDGTVLTLFTKTLSTGIVKYGIIDLRLAVLPVNLLLGLVFLAVFGDFSEQASAYFVKNTRGVLKFGLYGYLMALLLIGIFFVSVSGAVIAVAGLAVLTAVTMAGHVPASVWLGYKMLDGRLEKYNIYALFIAGSVVIDAVRLLPLIGTGFIFIIMPAVSIGIFSVYVIHGRFYRAYVRMSFEKNARFDRGRINGIITGASCADAVDGRSSK